jgi:biotin carboxyl carrier protein
MIDGKVGSKMLSWLDAPKGKSGRATVKLADGKTEVVSWTRDDQGIWIETARGCFGYDVRKTETDEGAFEYQLLRRRHFEVVNGVNFFKAGEGDSSSAQKIKKGAKVKSQMPGKILRILAKVGDTVTRGQSLMVMEAMKMENEIKSSQDGVIKEVKVSEGQAVETGAELLTFV